MKWAKDKFYTLCKGCVKKYKKEGKLIKLMCPPVNCSLCGKDAVKEFYPHSTWKF